MAELKTQPHDGSVQAFLESVENPQRREDAFTVLDLMKRVTGEEPVLHKEPLTFEHVPLSQRSYK